MDVSIIIVNYNTKQLLSNCLNSIKDKTKDIEYEIIVVDNNSHDGSQEMLKNDFPWVRLIESKENLGFGRANNLGMKNAQGKYFFLLNSDTILVNNAIKDFYDYSESHPGFGALGSILLDKNLKPCHSYGKFPTQLRTLKDALAKYLRFLKDKNKFHPEMNSCPLEVEYITGADLWISRNVFERTSGFDPDYFMYFEESDWQKRMDDIGLKRYIIPGPKIIHLEGGSDSSKSHIWSPNRLKNFYKSQKIYHHKHFNKWTYPLFRIAYLVINTPSLIMLTIVKNKGGVQRNNQNSVAPIEVIRKRASYDHSIKRYIRILLFWFTNAIPFSRFKRASLFRRLGVDIEPGTARLGTVNVDTLHPEDIHIGKGTAIANGVTLLTHFYDPKNLNEHAFYRGEIHIGRNCYIGSNTIFTKPVTVGDGVVIGAGSVVTKDIPPYEVWAGVPAKFICKRYDDLSQIPSSENFKPR